MPLYREQPDLAPARRRLTPFLVQYWGGPGTYSAGRGHPRLRKRHAPFAIGSLQRDRWLVHMFAALEAVGGDIPQPAREHLDHYFTMAADPMPNSPDRRCLASGHDTPARAWPPAARPPGTRPRTHRLRCGRETE